MGIPPKDLHLLKFDNAEFAGYLPLRREDKPLRPAARRCLLALAEFTVAHDRPPKLAEIAAVAKISAASVQGHVEKLRHRGLLRGVHRTHGTLALIATGRQELEAVAPIDSPKK